MPAPERPSQSSTPGLNRGYVPPYHGLHVVRRQRRRPGRPPHRSDRLLLSHAGLARRAFDALTEPFFQGLTSDGQCSTSSHTEALLAFSRESREAVDQMVETALEAAGRPARDPTQGRSRRAASLPMVDGGLGPDRPACLQRKRKNMFQLRLAITPRPVVYSARQRKRKK